MAKRKKKRFKKGDRRFKEVHKVRVTISLDPDVVETLKKEKTNSSAYVNDLLRYGLGLDREPDTGGA